MPKNGPGQGRTSDRTARRASRNAPRPRRRLNWLPWVLLALVAAYTGAHWTRRVVPASAGPHLAGHDRAFMDFDVYLTGARQLADGRSLYAATDTLPRPPCVGDETMEYLYTPLLALALRPLAGLSPCAAEWIWFALNLAACACLVPLLVFGLRLPRTPGIWALALGLVAAPMATLETLSLGQVNFLALALMLGCLVLADRGRVVAAALLLAAAVGLKMVPALLGLVILHRRRRDLLAWSVGLSALLLVAVFAAAPASTPHAWLAAMDARTVGGIAQLNNASWVAAVARSRDLGPDAIRALVRLNTLLVVVVGAWAWWRVRDGRAPSSLIALAFALAVALSPVLEVHHQVLLYPSLMILTLAMARQPRPAARLAGLLGVAVLAALLNSRGLVPPAKADGLGAHLLVKPAGAALWVLIAWLLCLRSRSTT